MYAIVRTGGKQYHVEEGQALLVERLPAGDGENVALEPLLYVDGSNVVDGDDLSKVRVEARVVAHERGPKLRVVKFKPKRGYKRRTGHRQELTRLEVTGIKLGARRSSSKAAEAGTASGGRGAGSAASGGGAGSAASGGSETSRGSAAKPEPSAAKPEPKPRARKPSAPKPKEGSDGS